uniref:Uncharacterized protein n=1 Tax=Romanomermis culicivorax TaxID=13658 RepID=A0A915JEG4_ROMCU
MAESKKKMRLKEKERRKKDGKGAKVEDKEEDSKMIAKNGHIFIENFDGGSTGKVAKTSQQNRQP